MSSYVLCTQNMIWMCKWCLRFGYWHNIPKFLMMAITKCFLMFHFIVFCENHETPKLYDNNVPYFLIGIWNSWEFCQFNVIPIWLIVYIIHYIKNIVIFIDLGHGAWYLWIHVTPKFGLASSCFKCPLWLFHIWLRCLKVVYEVLQLVVHVLPKAFSILTWLWKAKKHAPSF